MYFQPLSALLLILAPVAFSAPTSLPTKNANEAADVAAVACLTTCGSVCYESAAVTAARNAGHALYQAGDTVGNNDYPHRYNNYEGFDFLVDGPWYEFPIMSGGDIFDGSFGPGPDRVIFNAAGQRAGEITHTGASGNNFVGCTGTDFE